MQASLPRRGLLVLAIALVLALPAAAGSSPAAAVAWAPTAFASVDLVSNAWSWLKALWPLHGCGSDPDGLGCANRAPRLRPEEGCGSDPSGQHCVGAPAVRPLHGCGSDPSGQNCGTNAVRPQYGCGSDPNGQCGGSLPITPTARRAGGSRAPAAKRASRGGHR